MKYFRRKHCAYLHIKEYLFLVSTERSFSLYMKCKLDVTPFDLGKIYHIKAETELGTKKQMKLVFFLILYY